MGNKSVETCCPFGVLKAHFPPQLYYTTPSPQNNVGFPVSWACPFPVQLWNGGVGVALDVNEIWNGLSKMLELALDSVNCLNHFFSPIVDVI